MAQRTNHQDKIIRNYYENRDQIALQKLGEDVTELYLAEGKSKQKVWLRIKGHLEKLKVPASRIAHLEKADNPALVATLLQELWGKE